MARNPLDPPLAGPTKRVLDRVEQRSVCDWIMKRLPRRVQHRHPSFGNQEADRAAAAIELLSDPAPDLAALLSRCAHQCHLRVVAMEIASRIVRRHRIDRPKIDHVEGADRANIRHARARDRAEPVSTGAEHAAEQVIADLSRRYIDDPAYEAAINELLHCASPGSGRVKYHAIEAVPKLFGDSGDAGRRDAEHGQRD